MDLLVWASWLVSFPFIGDRQCQQFNYLKHMDYMQWINQDFALVVLCTLLTLGLFSGRYLHTLWISIIWSLSMYFSMLFLNSKTVVQKPYTPNPLVECDKSMINYTRHVFIFYTSLRLVGILIQRIFSTKKTTKSIVQVDQKQQQQVALETILQHAHEIKRQSDLSLNLMACKKGAIKSDSGIHISNLLDQDPIFATNDPSSTTIPSSPMIQQEHQEILEKLNHSENLRKEAEKSVQILSETIHVKTQIEQELLKYKNDSDQVIDALTQEMKDLKQCIGHVEDKLSCSLAQVSRLEKALQSCHTEKKQARVELELNQLRSSSQQEITQLSSELEKIKSQIAEVDELFCCTEIQSSTIPHTDELTFSDYANELPFAPVENDEELRLLCAIPDRLIEKAKRGFYITGDLSMIGYPLGIPCDIPITRFTFASALPEDAISFALGPQHMIALLPDQKTVVTFGSNDEGQCGHSHPCEDVEMSTHQVDVWTCPKERHIVKTVASDCASFVLLDDGSIWGWGTLLCLYLTDEEKENGLDEADITEEYGSLDPSQPIRIDDTVVDMAAGNHMVFFITQDGLFGSFGMAIYGELGYENTDFEYDRETLLKPFVRALPDESKAIRVFAGYGQGFIIDEWGRCWGWGINYQGQLGVDPNKLDVIDYPEIVHLPENEKVVHVAVGERHTLFLTEKGDVYGVGDNRNGQLRIQDEHYKKWYLCPIKIASNVRLIACGSFHSILVSQFGHVLVSGCNDGGQTGCRPLLEASTSLCEPWETLIVKRTACSFLPDTALVPSEMLEKRVRRKHSWDPVEEKLSGTYVQLSLENITQVYANSTLSVIRL